MRTKIVLIVSTNFEKLTRNKTSGFETVDDEY